MRKKKLSLLFIGLAALFSGCFYDKEELLYPAPPCNPTGSTYSATVAPIISARCVSCHGSAVANVNAAGIVLDNYNSIRPYAISGKLVGAINHASGYQPMPKNSAKLSSCDIAKITDWVNNGALNN
jgi:mono/diheme cytochrome c family protein